MKLSKDTLSIFKNFSAINTNLTLKAGNKLTTLSSGKNIIAEAIVSDSFPIEFGIYDLNEFLGALSLFADPELDFKEKFVTIKEGSHSIKYYGAAPSVLTVVPVIKQFPTPDIEFDLTSVMLNQIQRVASILKSSDFSIIGDGTIIAVSVGDKTNATSNTFYSEIGTTDKIFRVNIKVENLKMMSSDYRVSIAAKKISRFVSQNLDLLYFIAIELDSTFEF